MTPDDLEVTFNIFGVINWLHPPSFMSIYHCLPHLISFDLGWPLMTLKLPLFFSASAIDPIHQVSCPYTNVYPVWPLDDPWWPWSDLHNFRNQQLTPLTKFHVHRPMCTLFYLIRPWMTPDDLEVTSKLLVSLIDPTHQVSCPYTDVYPIWPHLTLDDPWWPRSDIQNFQRP